MPRKTTSPVLEPEPVADLTENKPFDQFIDYQKKAVGEVGQAFRSLIPEGVRDHGQKAVREMVEGYRTLFNAALDDVIKTLEKARIEDQPTEKSEE